MISARSVVDTEAVGSGTRIGDFVVVQDGVVLGAT